MDVSRFSKDAELASVQKRAEGNLKKAVDEEDEKLFKLSVIDQISSSIKRIEWSKTIVDISNT